MKEHHNGCEWNPDKDNPSYSHDPHYLNSTAVWSVGTKTDNNFHLCENCVKLPRFKRFKKVRLKNDIS